MIAILLDVVSWIFIVTGIFFVVVGATGLLRMPDIYTRLHAAGMTDTMGSGFILLGLCLQSGASLNVVRLLLVWAFLLLTSPISTHALARAALSGGVEPYRNRGD